MLRLAKKIEEWKEERDGWLVNDGLINGWMNQWRDRQTEEKDR